MEFSQWTNALILFVVRLGISTSYFSSDNPFSVPIFVRRLEQVYSSFKQLMTTKKPQTNKPHHSHKSLFRGGQLQKFFKLMHFPKKQPALPTVVFISALGTACRKPSATGAGSKGHCWASLCLSLCRMGNLSWAGRECVLTLRQELPCSTQLWECFKGVSIPLQHQAGF